MIKIVKKDNKYLFKKQNKIVAFIFENKNGFNYAFGKPSQQGGYIAFSSGTDKKFTFEDAKNRVMERITEGYIF